MSFVRLSNMPSPPKLRVSTIRNLQGGLNVHDLAWQLRDDQSPEMRNMWWQEGVLQSRPGQTTYNNGAIISIDTPEGVEYDLDHLRAYERLFHGWYVIHDPLNKRFIAIAGYDLQYSVPLKGVDTDEVFTVDYPDGTFFMHNDVLFYKSKGGYYRISASDKTDSRTGLPRLVAEDVVGYVPTILINATPWEWGAGSLYQPINRLSRYRTVTFNMPEYTEVEIDGDIEKGRGEFNGNLRLPEKCAYIDPETDEWVYGDVKVEYLTTEGKWKEVPAKDYTIRTSATKDKSYIILRTFDDELGFPDEDLAEGVSNNIRVTYCVVSEEDQAVAHDEIMDCNIATVYGGGSGLCVVLAGCDRQPNAYFWNSNTNVAMDPTYFPEEHYNLAGDVSDPITAFGQQQNMLVIFQKHRIGRSTFGTAEADGRTFITMDYTSVNPEVGCDLPNTVQLIDNNLVFCNSRKGVMYIKDSSAVYENNIVQISRNIEQHRQAGGFLYDINHDAPESVISLDDGRRYWILVNGHAWLWDYSLGGSINSPESLSWFYFDHIANPACWFGFEEEIPWFFGRDGYVHQFKTTVADTTDDETGYWTIKGEDFTKEVTTPIQDFGTNEVLKNVEKAIFEVRGAGDATIDITYETDYEERKDRQPIVTHGFRAWLPRDMTKGRSLKYTRFAVTAIRKPRCLHVRHFLIRLSNRNRAEMVSFISAEIYFTLQGVDR